MPKPMYHQAGNGMHLHLYLTKNGKNAFYKKGEYGNVNELGRYFIGGYVKTWYRHFQHLQIQVQILIKD